MTQSYESAVGNSLHSVLKIHRTALNDLKDKLNEATDRRNVNYRYSLEYIGNLLAEIQALEEIVSPLEKLLEDLTLGNANITSYRLVSSAQGLITVANRCLAPYKIKQLGGHFENLAAELELLKS